MKNIWVLSVKTSLPNTCYNEDDLVTELFAFESFDVAKDAFYEKYMELAYSTNEMFDENGVLRELDSYIDEMLEEEIEDESFLTKELCNKIKLALHTVFYKKDFDLEIKDGRYDDGMICVEVCGNEVKLSGTGCGPINGYDPVLHTNIFNMAEKKDYFLYINDRFGQEGDSSELYIDLQEVELQ